MNALLLLLALVGLPAQQPNARPELTPPRVTVRTLAFPNVVPLNVCYTMDTFVFKRYNGGDAVRLVGHRTCTKASMLRKKTVVLNPR